MNTLNDSLVSFYCEFSIRSLQSHMGAFSPFRKFSLIAPSHKPKTKLHTLPCSGNDTIGFKSPLSCGAKPVELDT